MFSVFLVVGLVCETEADEVLHRLDLVAGFCAGSLALHGFDEEARYDFTVVGEFAYVLL